MQTGIHDHQPTIFRLSTSFMHEVNEKFSRKLL